MSIFKGRRFFLVPTLALAFSPCATFAVAQDSTPISEVSISSQFSADWLHQEQVVEPLQVHVPAEQFTLSLEQLQSIAIDMNPSLQRAAAEVNAARGRCIQVGLNPNPDVGIDFQQLGSSGLAEQYGASVSQEIVRRQKLRLNRAVGAHQVHELEQDYMAQRQRVLTDVRIAFIRALRAQRQIDVTRELVAISERALVVAQQLRMAQEVGKADVLQAELEVENARIELRNAENRHAAVWRELAAVTGQSGLVIQTLEGDLFAEKEPIRFEQALSVLQTSSPEISSAVERIEAARCQLAREQIEPMPNVTVSGLVNWRDNGANGQSDGGLAVSVPLPLWNRNQGAIQQARFELVAAQRELEQRTLDLQQRLAPTYERYSNARQQSQTYREQIIPRAEETLELTRTAYELGEVSFVNLLTIQRTYAENRLRFIDSLEALRVAEAEIEGLLLLGSLSVR